MQIEELEILISQSEKQLEVDLKEIWNDIKISPVKWKNMAEDREFWVVAITSDEVIWYNDISKGFNISKYKIEGEISEYWDDETSLPDLLWHLF